MWIPLRVQKQFDGYAVQVARPVRGHHLVGLAGVGYFLWEAPYSPGFALTICIVLVLLAIALNRRHETLEYNFRDRGIDPYNKKQVKEHQDKIHRELREKGIIPPR